MEHAPAQVIRTVRLDVDLEAAWRLIGTQDGLAHWLGVDVALDPTAGAALRVVDDDGVAREGRVVEVDEGHRLAFSWTDAAGDESTVTLTVDADGEGTRVTVVEERAGGTIAACLDAGAAWDDRLLQLDLASWTRTAAWA